MKTVQVFGLFLIIAFSLVGFQGCEENPVVPQVGSGTVLKATIEGQPYTFRIASASYDADLIYGEFAGSTDEEPVQSITLSFNYDIDNGTFPKILTGGDLSIIVVTNDELGTQKSYLCPVLSGNCRLTLTATDKEIVDGTFSGTLENSQDSNDKLTVIDGEFSVKLPRN